MTPWPQSGRVRGPRCSSARQRSRAAVPELESHPDDLQLRESTRTEAHKLAGLLGTLGLPTGTDLARAIEHRLDPDAPPPDIAELRRLAAELRVVIESKH